MITQEKLAAATGISTSDIAAIERGETAITNEKLPALAEALNVHPAVLASKHDIGEEELAVALFVHRQIEGLYQNGNGAARYRVMENVARCLMDPAAGTLF